MAPVGGPQRRSAQQGPLLGEADAAHWLLSASTTQSQLTSERSSLPFAR